MEDSINAILLPFVSKPYGSSGSAVRAEDKKSFCHSRRAFVVPEELFSCNTREKKASEREEGIESVNDSNRDVALTLFYC